MGRLLFAIVLFAVGFVGAVWLTAVSTDRELGDLLSQDTFRQLMRGEGVTLETAEERGPEDSETVEPVAATPDDSVAASDDEPQAESEQDVALADAEAQTEEEGDEPSSAPGDESDTGSESDSDQTASGDRFVFGNVATDGDGRLAVTGTAPPGAPVELLLGDEVAASTNADDEGRFSLRTSVPLPAGKNELTLRSETGSGTPVISPETLTVTVPDEADMAMSAIATNSATEEQRTIKIADPSSDDEEAAATRDGEQAPADDAAEDVVAAADEGGADRAVEDDSAAEGSLSDPAANEAETPSTNLNVEEATDAPSSQQALDQGDVPAEDQEVAELSEPAVSGATDAEEAAASTADSDPAAGEDEEAARPNQADDADGNSRAEPVSQEASADTETDGTADDGTARASVAEETTDDGTNSSQSAPVAPVLPRIEAIEIDGPSVLVTGAAKPGSRIRIFAGDDELGVTKANENGRFLLETDADIPVGPVSLRAEELGDEDDVVRSSVTPFERTPGERVTAVAEASAADGGASSEGSEQSTADRPQNADEATETASEAADVMANATAEGQVERPSEEEDAANRPSASGAEPDPSGQPDDADGAALSSDQGRVAQSTEGESQEPSAASLSDTSNTGADQAVEPDEAEPGEVDPQVVKPEPSAQDVASKDDAAPADKPASNSTNAPSAAETGTLPADDDRADQDAVAANTSDTGEADTAESNQADGPVSPGKAGSESDSAFERARSAMERAGSALRGMMDDKESEDAASQSASPENGTSETGSDPISGQARDDGQAADPSQETAEGDTARTAQVESEADDKATDETSRETMSETTDEDADDAARLPAPPSVFEVRRGDTIRSLTRLLYGPDVPDAAFVDVSSGKVVETGDLRPGMHLRLPKAGPARRQPDLEALGTRLISATDK
ncbi:hypothetical protein [Notoacmeibacter ruber]|uniref:LysM domain-containing protein n=1 Tax=Notoacmeibacter ruber TaxID=2670375 RepID=A0A3L7JAG3_9HYPH|nr:hypothetical protein [Notoacmeibacter ruber]RLQ87616.1 hypothetical protein D8780_04755 [Notoacmeibacter ruber]